MLESDKINIDEDDVDMMIKILSMKKFEVCWNGG